MDKQEENKRRKILKRFDDLAEKNYECYQSYGERVYEKRYEEYSIIADCIRESLNAADARGEKISLERALIEAAKEADDALHQDDEKRQQALKSIVSTARIMKLYQSPWKDK